MYGKPFLGSAGKKVVLGPYFFLKGDGFVMKAPFTRPLGKKIFDA